MRIRDMSDKYIILSQKAVEGTSISRVPGRFWVEFFPILRYIPAWVPGSSARKVGELYKPVVSAMINEPYEKVERDMVCHSLLSGLAHNDSCSGQGSSKSMYCRGTDTGTSRKVHQHERIRATR